MSIPETLEAARGFSAQMPSHEELLANITESLARLSDDESRKLRKCAMDAVEVARETLADHALAEQNGDDLIELVDDLLELVATTPTSKTNASARDQALSLMRERFDAITQVVEDLP